jgi:hypothetical protein
MLYLIESAVASSAGLAMGFFPSPDSSGEMAAEEAKSAVYIGLYLHQTKNLINYLKY